MTPTDGTYHRSHACGIDLLIFKSYHRRRGTLLFFPRGLANREDATVVKILADLVSKFFEKQCHSQKLH